MEKATETTFKDLQMDERYKRLERTLKMVLLRNAELNNGNACTWPSISSINGDNLDTSCAAMSVQSSRLGSEIVSSSLNLRNIVTHKKSSFVPRHNMVTSSENQFPIKKDHDRVMMPPPKFPGPSSGRSRKFTPENKRTPLLNVSMNLERNDDDFAGSAPTSNDSSISRCPESAENSSAPRYGENADYLRRNIYDESNGGSQPAKAQERIFSRWRVLLNDKAQLIIKGTLECGKIARSKPVIRRLAATSVQSIFKHTYHLRGNLVDERHELPDYVSGKFYNGFPDDWENVYQVWRNFVSDGSRLSFRWPTPITDSDDDIKSEITEISYCPKFPKLEKSRSPRKRTRYAKPSSPIFSSANKSDNYTKMNESSRSRLNTSTPGIPKENSVKTSKVSQDDESIVQNNRIESNKSLNSTSNACSDGNQRVVANSLKDIIQEDKLNIIIDNLTNKNCSLEYIKKIVEMFDCMKYVVSYQSTGSSDAEYHSGNIEKSSCSEKTKNHFIEETKNNITPRCSANRFANQSVETIREETDVTKKLREDRCTGDARRKLTEDDYESGESESDIFDERKRSSIGSSRTKKRREDRARSRVASRQFERSSEKRVRKTERDPSLSDEELPMTERTRTKESRDRVHARRSQIPDKDFRDSLDRYDSSISLTEDENARDYKKEKRTNAKARAETYDSSVSITEDERGDAGIDRKIVDSNVVKSNDFPDGGKAISKCYDRSNCSSNDSGIDRNADQWPMKRSNIVKSTESVKENIQTSRHNIDVPRENRADYVSSDVKRQKGVCTVRAIVEPETNHSCNDFRRDFNDHSSSPSKSMIQQKNKPVVIASTATNIDTRRFHRSRTKNDNGDIDNAPRLLVDRSESDEKKFDEIKIGQKEPKISANLASDRARVGEHSGGKTMKKGTSLNVEDQNNKEGMKETSLERGKIDAKFGSENNPKKLTGWIPAVICEDDDSKCRLVFQGKLINEAGHVANRKFTTDFVMRRLSPKLIETDDNVFYQLVGDLNDTKRAVPLGLVKLCHGGCPSKINQFCQKWKALSSENNETTLAGSRSHNTSVDCLSVRTSSRGRRILPPLNYWNGERVTTKGDQAIYSPGNCHESSIPSSLEKSNEDNVSERKSPRSRTRRVLNYETREKQTAESRTNSAKNPNVEKPLSPSSSKSPTKQSPNAEGSQKLRSGKRRLVRKMHDSSSDSDGEEAKTKLLRKRKSRTNNPSSNAKSTSDRKLRNVSKNTASSQSLEKSTSSRSFEKPVESDGKLKLRKRRKMNQDEAQTVIAGTSKQLTTRGSPAITCTLYKNVPLHDGDLSEDQLSII